MNKTLKVKNTFRVLLLIKNTTIKTFLSYMYLKEAIELILFIENAHNNDCTDDQPVNRLSLDS